MKKTLWAPVFSCFFILATVAVSAQEREIIDDNNAHGGQTVEIANMDDSFVRIYYDADNSIVKEETIFSVEYPIDNGLDKRVIHYSFEKKVKEERVYRDTMSKVTLIRRTIDHYDRFTGLMVKSENHFVKPHSGYNIIYRKKGVISKVEWYYPENVEGISKNIVYYDEYGRGAEVESFFTEKTIKENGYFKRICYNEYSPNKYFRKKRQEWYYTDAHAAIKGISKKIQNFHYRPGELVRVETNFFDKNGAKIF
ncbi:MAG: hypothetical protein GY866_22320 [Proteobacteria bacterium]|nr:hypothetical protein [Pseudomonadota bacterium]